MSVLAVLNVLAVLSVLAVPVLRGSSVKGRAKAKAKAKARARARAMGMMARLLLEMPHQSLTKQRVC